MSAAISASVIAAGLVGGAWAGYRAGRDGRKLASAMARAAGRSGLLIIACTSIIAPSISLHELRSAKGRYLMHKPGYFGCECFDCMETELFSSPTPMTRSCLEYKLHDPMGAVLSSISPGAIWAFLAPAFAVFAAIPSAIAGGVAHTFGTRTRARCYWLKVQHGLDVSDIPEGSPASRTHPATPRSHPLPDT